MSTKPPSRRQNIPTLLAVFTVAGSLAALARLPDPPAGMAERLAARFRLTKHDVPPIPMPAGGVQYPVNKTAAHMQFYFYQVGESAALGDLDGDGLPNDLCMTDVRTKSAMVRPVEGSGNRYPPFVLDFGSLVDRLTVYPSVCRIADMNEDGLSDIFVAFYGRPPLLLLRRDSPDLKSAGPISMASYDIVELVPGLSERWWTATAAFADVDGDGHQDLIVGNYYPDGAEITDPNSDKPFEMNDEFSRSRNGGKNRIFLFNRNRTNDRHEPMYRDAGDVFPNRGAYGWTLAIGAADLDGDGLSDLYIANDFGPDQLLWNHSTPGKVQLLECKGERGFTRPPSTVIGHDSFKGMSIDFGDINHDGVFDMFVSNIGSPFALQESHFLWVSDGKPERMSAGKAPWTDRASELGVAHSAWSWDTRFEDLDNDGELELMQATGLVRGSANRWPDLAQVGAANDALVKYQKSWPKFLIGSDVDGSYPNPIYVREPNGQYVDVSTTLFPGLTSPTRGIAVADVNGDGYPEFVYANFWEESNYISNESTGNSYLGLHLLLPIQGRDSDGQSRSAVRVHDGHPAWREGTPAIGAFVEAEVSGGQRQIRQVDGGNGHSGQRSPEVRFGLGRTQAKEVPVKIRWRDFAGALHQTALSLSPGYHTIVLEGEPTK